MSSSYIPAYTVDGVYSSVVPAPPGLPPGPATGLIAIVGGANWGPVNTPTGFTDQASLAATFGSDTLSSHSLAREALTAMPEASQFLGSRVTDGTDVAATCVILDNEGSPKALVTLTAKHTGSLPNANGGAILTLQSGTLSANPVFQLQLVVPGLPTETYPNISGGTGAFAPATFIANAVAAVNGTARNAVGSVNWTATAGIGTGMPATLGSLIAATGGVDGTTSITSTILQGTAALAGSTGMYALAGLIAGGQFMLASNVDPTTGANIIAFAQQQNSLGHLCFPMGTATATAIATRATDALASPYLVLSIDWLQVNDTNSGTTFYVSPQGKVAGVIAATNPWDSPGNSPVNGVSGIITTERITNGINTVQTSEKSLRQLNGLIYVGYMPRALSGPILGLPHGMTSLGYSNGWPNGRIDTIRMQNDTIVQVNAVEGPFVDGPMSVAAANLGAPTAGSVEDALHTLFSGWQTNNQISDYSVTPNLTQTAVAQGQAQFGIAVTTLSDAQFLINAVQVGATVVATVASA